jgi:hypothetical protein
MIAMGKILKCKNLKMMIGLMGYPNIPLPVLDT